MHFFKILPPSKKWPFCNNRTFTLVGTPNGGTWSSSSNAVFNVSNVGVVSTVGLGTATLTYSTGLGGCKNERGITGTVVGCASRGINGVSQFAIENYPISVNLYPNPARSIVSFQIDKLVGTGDIIITDLMGKQVKKQLLSIGINNINIASLSKGYYLVSVIANEEKNTQKLIIE